MLVVNLPLLFVVGIGVIFASVAGSMAFAEEPRLALPVDCEMGVVCSVQNYIDRDPGPGFRDYACGSLTYDGHKGTDIRVPDLPTMAEGIPVVAAAPGRVRAVRDGMQDVDVREIGVKAVQGREAGNAVVVVHGGGWETQYSHLQRGSIAVSKGDTVAAGQKLGLIGMSGRAEFPHVHFEVRFEGRPVDPFVGRGGPAECGVGASTLWRAEALEALSYATSGVLATGFAAGVPEWRAARRGAYRYEHLRTDAPALVFWVSVYGIQEGDVEVVQLVAPDETVLAEKSERRDKTKAQWFSYVGHKRRTSSWPSGVWRGEFRLLREIDGELHEVLHASREIEVR